MLSYKELQILKREVERLRELGNILDPSNVFEAKELRSVISQLKEIAYGSTEKKASNDKKLKLVRFYNNQ